MPDTDSFMIDNSAASYAKWGKLVQTWATGEDRVYDGQSYLPRPSTIDELNAMLQKAGFGPTSLVPSRYVNLVFCQSDHDTLVIRLPEKDILSNVEAQVSQPGGAWMLPAFYETEFGAHQVDPKAPLDLRLDLMAMRIGDYTIGVCANK